MSSTTPWEIARPSVDRVLGQFELPLESLANGEIPAIVLKGVYDESCCQGLTCKLVNEGLLFDPNQPVPETFQQQAIPEGYYREGQNSMPKAAWTSEGPKVGRTRIDIGTSLGYRGSDKETFLQHSAETHRLFEELFATADNPVGKIYENLERLSVHKRAVTAYEPDGRSYGPAIIRAHYGGYTYKPHFDSVRLREKRHDYAVSRFDHQFAGVLVLQNTQHNDRTAQCVIHRCLWTEEVDPYLKSGRFTEFSGERAVESVEVCLEPGDLYFFNTRAIHEVPGVAGHLPRIVLATFIGYSSDRDEMFVWA